MDSTAINYIDTLFNGMTIPHFVDPMVEADMNTGVITRFTKEYPTSKYGHLRRIWRVEGLDSNILNNVVSNHPNLFPGYERIREAYLCGYIPNDWNSDCKYLEFQNAPDAWDALVGGTQGDSNVIIGITDSYFDENNLDLKGKYTLLNPNLPPIGSVYFGHGTGVAGLAAGSTDNGILFPSIGFNCRLDLSNNWGLDSAVLRVCQDSIGGKTRVFNGSWGIPDLDGGYNRPFYGQQDVYTEIYEMGITCCFSAGNGRPLIEENPRNFLWPASYDHNISVTSISHLNTSGTAGLEDIHESIAGDSITTCQHNSSVDLCSTGDFVGGLNCHETDTSIHTTYWFGTSFASPIVAGTCALMYSNNPCLTPYQVEWLLKMSSVDIYNKSYGGSKYNLKYAGPSRHKGRLGSGRLDAGQSVINAKIHQCNDPRTQTFAVEGVEVNHLCAPGVSVGLSRPKLTVILNGNGTPPYSYIWEPIKGNTCNLNNYTSGTPEIISGNGLFLYRVTVFDSSEIQKVASKVVSVQLHTTLTPDLAMRDSYVDLLDEPNTQYEVNHNNYDIWHSPDLWNRDTIDGRRYDQNPEYFSLGTPNFLYARIRNVGCISNEFDQATLHLYWTLASTGEQWNQDWDGTTHVASNSSYSPILPPTIPGGGYITNGSPVLPVKIPIIAPGDSFITAVPWYPMEPQKYQGGPSSVDVCFLGRILETNLPNNGISFPEVARSATNVNNNNNIVTKNLMMVNLGSACATCKTTNNTSAANKRFYFASSESEDQVYTLEMISQKDIDRHLSGNISEYVFITLKLGELFDRWQASGGVGNFATINPELKTVTYDPSSPLRLHGINLHAGEHFPIDVTFSLRSGVKIPYKVDNYNIYARQFISEGNGDRLYGVVKYCVNIAANDVEQAQKPSDVRNPAIELPASYSVYPNPVSDLVRVGYSGTVSAIVRVYLTDITGKTIFRKHDIRMHPGSTFEFKISQMAPGTYMIHIEDDLGNVGSQKVTKD